MIPFSSAHLRDVTSALAILAAFAAQPAMAQDEPAGAQEAAAEEDLAAVEPVDEELLEEDTDDTDILSADTLTLMLDARAHHEQELHR